MKKKGFFEKLNKFNDGLYFTMENMTNNKIVFLDTTVVNTNGYLHLERYRKPTASENIINFKHAVTSKGQTISTLVGELYQCNHTTSTPEALDTALFNTKNIFLKNQYPEKLINQKIKELKTKKFPPSQSKARRAEELKNLEIVSHYITLLFTTFRCSVIASKINTKT
jgi:hypothetical protein